MTLPSDDVYSCGRLPVSLPDRRAMDSPFFFTVRSGVLWFWIHRCGMTDRRIGVRLLGAFRSRDVPVPYTAHTHTLTFGTTTISCHLFIVGTVFPTPPLTLPTPSLFTPYPTVWWYFAVAMRSRPTPPHQTPSHPSFPGRYGRGLRLSAPGDEGDATPLPA